MDFGAKLSASNCGNLGIPEFLDKDCKAIIRQHENSIDGLSGNPQKPNEFATGSHDKTVMIWDTNNLKAPVKVLKGHNEGIWNVNYTQNGQQLSTASPEGICKIWDVRGGKSVQDLKHHTKRCYKAMFSANDQMIATCGSDRLICVWDLRKAAKPVVVNN